MFVLFLQVILIPKRNASKDAQLVNITSSSIVKDVSYHFSCFHYYYGEGVCMQKIVPDDDGQGWREQLWFSPFPAIIYPFLMHPFFTIMHSCHLWYRWYRQYIRRLLEIFKKSTKSLEMCMSWNELYNLWNRNNAILFFQIST